MTQTRAAQPRFGTDGWRAIIAEDFTFDNVRLVAAAASRFIRENATGTPAIAVGCDTRFLSREFAKAFAATAASCGVRVLLSKNFCPTPALSFTVKHKKLAAGIMITASHNPAAYNGIKFKGPYGGPAMAGMTQGIERSIRELGGSWKSGPAGGKVVTQDFLPAYYRQIERYVDTSILKRFAGRIVYNPMFGAGIGSVDGFLQRLGLDVSAINNHPNPLFGGHGPEPIPQNLADQTLELRRQGAVLGLATDGDADRFGVLDSKGEFVQLHDLMPLLFTYVAQTRGWSGGVVRTSSMADTVDKAAEKLGRSVMETPVGFKHVCERMLDHDILIGGEESGGFGYKNHIPERDGVLSCLLLVEMLAARGVTIRRAVQELRKAYGPFAYGRIDRHCPAPKLRENFSLLIDAPPANFAGLKVSRVSTADGIKFHFQDGSWMLMRISDTEPVGRIYVASSSQALADKILRAGAHRLFGR
ncbi:MAG: phosphoglucomutase/phosphomannomutase family protein [bacterium]|nr:phosphoglucomutase/phosphomannomutase family protein [Candidatus Sumerlaeota bacterium]